MKSEAYVNLYNRVVEGKLLIIVIYVSNLILTGDEKLIKYYKQGMSREFEMKDIRLMYYFLGMPMSYSGDSTWREVNPWRFL